MTFLQWNAATGIDITEEIQEEYVKLTQQLVIPTENVYEIGKLVLYNDLKLKQIIKIFVFQLSNIKSLLEQMKEIR